MPTAAPAQTIVQAACNVEVVNVALIAALMPVPS
jgi:hypothetical protein